MKTEETDEACKSTDNTADVYNPSQQLVTNLLELLVDIFSILDILGITIYVC